MIKQQSVSRIDASVVRIARTTTRRNSRVLSCFLVVFLITLITVPVVVSSQESSSSGTTIRKSHYQPKPAGPKLSGTISIHSQSSNVPRYGTGWIKFHVTVNGLPEGGINKLPNKSKVVLQTICQQEHFYETVNIRQTYSVNGVYTFYLKDDPKRNRGIDRPWLINEPAMCQTSLIYHYKYRDLMSPYGQMDYTLATTRVYDIEGIEEESTDTLSSEVS